MFPVGASVVKYRLRKRRSQGKQPSSSQRNLRCPADPQEGKAARVCARVRACTWSQMSVCGRARQRARITAQTDLTSRPHLPVLKTKKKRKFHGAHSVRRTRARKAKASSRSLSAPGLPGARASVGRVYIRDRIALPLAQHSDSWEEQCQGQRESGKVTKYTSKTDFKKYPVESTTRKNAVRPLPPEKPSSPTLDFYVPIFSVCGAGGYEYAFPAPRARLGAKS